MRHDYSFIMFCIGIALIITGFVIGFSFNEHFAWMFGAGVFTAIASLVWDIVKASKETKNNEFQRKNTS